MGTRTRLECEVRFTCPHTGEAVTVASGGIEITGNCENDWYPREHEVTVDCPSCKRSHDLQL